MGSGKASSTPSRCTSGAGSSPSDGTTASEETVVQKKPLQVRYVDLVDGTESAVSVASEGSGGGVLDKDKVSLSWRGVIGRDY